MNFSLLVSGTLLRSACAFGVSEADRRVREAKSMGSKSELLSGLQDVEDLGLVAHTSTATLRFNMDSCNMGLSILHLMSVRVATTAG